MDHYETPFWLYEMICEDFNVYPRLDVCATKENRKCKEYFDHDALNQEWNQDFFMNCPYSQANKWVKYAYFQHIKHNVNGIAVLNVSTGSSYWHDYIFDKASIAYYKGRIKFELRFDESKFRAYVGIVIRISMTSPVPKVTHHLLSTKSQLFWIDCVIPVLSSTIDGSAKYHRTTKKIKIGIPINNIDSMKGIINSPIRNSESRINLPIRDNE